MKECRRYLDIVISGGTHALVIMGQVGVVLLGVDTPVLYDVIHPTLKIAPIAAEVVPGSCTSSFSSSHFFSIQAFLSSKIHAQREDVQSCAAKPSASRRLKSLRFMQRQWAHEADK